MGIVLGLGTIASRMVCQYMVVNLEKDKITFVNGYYMSTESTFIFDDSVKDKCYELLQGNEVEIYYQDSVIYGIRDRQYMYGPKLMPGTFGYYLK